MANNSDYSDSILIDDWNPQSNRSERIDVSSRTYYCLLPIIIYFMFVTVVPQFLSSNGITFWFAFQSLFIIFSVGFLCGMLTHRMCQLELKDYYTKEKARMEAYYHKKK